MTLTIDIEGHDYILFLMIGIAIQGRGVSRIFERGGPISLGSLKKGHQILKGKGSSGLKGGESSKFVSL